MSEAIAAQTQRFQSLQSRLAKLLGQADALRQRDQYLRDSIGLNKAMQIQGPLATQVFQDLQARAHQRAVGDFEDMLSAMVQDVFPQAGRVKLVLGTRNGASTLDLYMAKGDALEGLNDGTGGSVTGAVLTGLIYGACDRAKLRPLVFLDEPDHWISKENVPAFTRVVADLARVRNTQTILISHASAEYIDENVHLIELYRDDKGLLATRALTPAEPWPDDLPGLRWMELDNIRGHVRTRFDFPPGATAVIGANNLGKSTGTLSPLRAIAYNESDDDILYHLVDDKTGALLYEAPEGRVRLGLEQGYVIEWVRKREGTPKVLYRIFKDGEKVFEGRPQVRGMDGVPAEITQLLNIRKVDGLDICLRHQKDPPFLLREADTVRAKVLSIGREASHLTDWLKAHRALQSQAKETVRLHELELADVTRQNRVLAGLSGFDTVQLALKGMLDELTAGAARISRLQALVAQLASLERAALILERAASLRSLEVPTLQDTRPLAGVIERLARLGLQARVPCPPPVPQLPVLADTETLARTIATLQGLACRRVALARLPAAVPAIPVLLDTQGLRTHGVRLARLAEQQAQLEKELLTVVTELPQAEARKEALREAVGVCPFCDQTMSSSGVPHAHPVTHTQQVHHAH